MGQRMRGRWQWRHGERGATGVEYALVIGLVSLLVIAGPVGLGANFLGYAADLVEHVGDLLAV